MKFTGVLLRRENDFIKISIFYEIRKIFKKFMVKFL